MRVISPRPSRYAGRGRSVIHEVVLFRQAVSMSGGSPTPPPCEAGVRPRGKSCLIDGIRIEYGIRGAVVGSDSLTLAVRTHRALIRHKRAVRTHHALADSA